MNKRMAPNKQSLSLKAIAYHEAGHVVVSWCLGVPVTRATVIPDLKQNSAGHIRNRKLSTQAEFDIEIADRFTAGRLQAEKRAMVSMAGALAQRRFNPRSVRPHHASGDRNQIIDVLMRYADPPGPDGVVDCIAHWKLLHQWTNSLLKRKWYLVEAVASALLEQRTLSGVQLRRLFVNAEVKAMGGSQR